MTEYAYSLDPLNDAAQKNYSGKTYKTLGSAYRAFHWYRSHVPDAFFAVRSCVISKDEFGCLVIRFLGGRL